MNEDTPGEAPLLDGVRQALATGHPLDLLGMASLLIEATTPDPLAFLKSAEPRDQVDLDRLVDSFIGVRVRETTALLTVFAELLDDEDLRLRCRREAVARHDDLPGWLTDLARVEAYRAVRMTHVLGDGDEVLIGARFANGDELTCAAFIDHDTMSAVKDAFFVPGPIGNVISIAAQSNTDPDRGFVDMSLADARAWIRQGPDNPLLWAESDSWPGCRPLLMWLIGHLPAGGATYQPPESDSDQLSEAFFASEYGAGYDRRDGHLLVALLDAARDPLRWSVPRVERALGGPHYDIPVSEALRAPALLRAFIPFAHARSGIRDELTAEALAAVDAITSTAQAGDTEGDA
jgi:hypothetical protein